MKEKSFEKFNDYFFGPRTARLLDITRRTEKTSRTFRKMSDLLKASVINIFIDILKEYHYEEVGQLSANEKEPRQIPTEKVFIDQKNAQNTIKVKMIRVSDEELLVCVQATAFPKILSCRITPERYLKMSELRYALIETFIYHIFPPKSETASLSHLSKPLICHVASFIQVDTLLFF
jgi:hypothetical protein